MKLKLSKTRYVKKEIKVIQDTVTLGVTAPSHRDILYVKTQEGPFLKALSTFRDEYLAFKEAYDAITYDTPDADKVALVERYNQITFKDLDTLHPIYGFISDYVVTIKGVEVEDEQGVTKDVEAWDDLTDDFKLQVLDEMTILEVHDVYRTILDLSALDPNV